MGCGPRTAVRGLARRVRAAAMTRGRRKGGVGLAFTNHTRRLRLQHPPLSYTKARRGEVSPDLRRRYGPDWTVAYTEFLLHQEAVPLPDEWREGLPAERERGPADPRPNV